MKRLWLAIAAILALQSCPLLAKNKSLEWRTAQCLEISTSGPTAIPSYTTYIWAWIATKHFGLLTEAAVQSPDWITTTTYLVHLGDKLYLATEGAGKPQRIDIGSFQVAQDEQSGLLVRCADKRVRRFLILAITDAPANLVDPPAGPSKTQKQIQQEWRARQRTLQK